MKDPQGIVRKQSLIDKTRKTVFLWVIGASCMIGAAIVLMILLVQTLLFNEKVLSEKSKTNTQLESSIIAAKELKGSIDVLNGDPQLKRVRTSENVPPTQSVLDALPADANQLAMGASLQKKLLNDIPDMRVEAISLGDNGSSAFAEQETSESSTEAQSQPFTLTLSGSPEALRTALERLERSIRAVDVQTLAVSSAEERLTIQVVGSMSYLPPMQIEKTEKMVKG